MTDDYIKPFVDDLNSLIALPLADGTFVVEAKWALINMFFWRPLVRRGLPILKKHLFHNTALSKKEIKRINHEIYKDARALNPDDIRITYELIDVINDLYNMASRYLGSYQVSISAFELCDLLRHPLVEPLTKVDIHQEANVGTTAIENKIKKLYDDMLQKLKDKTITPNILYPYMKLDLLSPQQLPQVLVALGYRTDVNDKTIRKPILDSFMSGMTNIIDYAIESLSAKKSIFYNKHGMDKSQYSNRKQQLLASVIRHLYKGDCGTPVTIAFMVTEHNCERLIGKYILDGDDRRLTLLSADNVRSYVGKIIHMRSPITCRYTDGICSVCGGQLTDYMHPDITVGEAAVIELMGPTSQLILSNKHFSQTKSSVYVIPTALKSILSMRNNDIYFSKPTDISQLMIGIPFMYMPRISDLQHIKDENSLNEQALSDISTLTLANNKTGKLLTAQIDMSDNTDPDNPSTPYFTTEMLLYIKRNMDIIDIGDTIWINMSRFDTSQPILRCTIENESMIKFTEKIHDMFESKISTYTSAPQALRDFSTTAYRKVKTNFMHLEVIIKACLVKSETDFTVPIVTDPENVRFGKLKTIINIEVSAVSWHSKDWMLI